MARKGKTIECSLSPLDRAVLRSGQGHENGRCFLPRRLSGTALNSVLISLGRRELVRIDWSVAGRSCSPTTPIGTLTDRGREIAREGLS